jgi:hypothetical protein
MLFFLPKIPFQCTVFPLHIFASAIQGNHPVTEACYCIVIPKAKSAYQQALFHHFFLKTAQNQANQQTLGNANAIAGNANGALGNANEALGNTNAPLGNANNIVGTATPSRETQTRLWEMQTSLRETQMPSWETQTRSRELQMP